MITIGANGGKIAYGLNYYILDYESDKIDLTEKTMGSTCFVIETSNYYMLNSKGNWIIIYPYGKGGEGSGDLPTAVVYDGGVVRQ